MRARKCFFFFFFLSDNQYIGELRSSGIERISQNWFKFFSCLLTNGGNADRVFVDGVVVNGLAEF